MIFTLCFVNMVYHVDLFVDIEPLLHPWINSTGSRCVILSVYCWIWFADILLRIFVSMFIGILVCHFLALCLSLVLLLEETWNYKHIRKYSLLFDFPGLFVFFFSKRKYRWQITHEKRLKVINNYRKQIITIKYYYTPIRMAKVEYTDEDTEKLYHSLCWW